MGEFQISTIIVTNVLGIMTLFLLVFVNQIWLMKKNRETMWLNLMIGITFLCCVIDPLTYLVDGRKGRLVRFILIAGNSWLYLSYVLLVVLGILFFLEHFQLEQKKSWKLIVAFLLVTGGDLVMLNLISPVIFEIEENNHFVRIHLWGLFFGMIYLAAFGMILYVYLKKTTRLTRFFPQTLIVIPLLIGTGIQYRFYGIPILWPCAAITLTALVSSLKNEQLYRDPLTGLYNRFYLPCIWRKMLKQARRYPGLQLYGLFFYINDFRQINQVYGYREGDLLLLDLSKLLQEVMKDRGVLFRYNFDSFVVFLAAEEEREVQRKRELLDERILTLNQERNNHYELSVTSRIGSFDPQSMSEEEFLSEVAEKIW